MAKHSIKVNSEHACRRDTFILVCDHQMERDSRVILHPCSFQSDRHVGKKADCGHTHAFSRKVNETRRDSADETAPAMLHASQSCLKLELPRLESDGRRGATVAEDVDVLQQRRRRRGNKNASNFQPVVVQTVELAPTEGRNPRVSHLICDGVLGPKIVGVFEVYYIAEFSAAKPLENCH